MQMKRLFLTALVGAGLTAVAIAMWPGKKAPVFTPVPGYTACRGAEGYADALGGARTFTFRADWLNDLKEAPRDSPAITGLLAEADAALARGPYSVMDKTRTPPSGNKHDYISLGAYFWPDPSKPDGLPYVGRDGSVNPEALGEQYDFSRMRAMREDVVVLALAYYVTGDEWYAEHGSDLLRTWFLDPQTAINPNLNHGQYLPGLWDGGKSGIMHAIGLVDVVDAVGLLAISPSLSDADVDGLKAWYRDFLDWLRSSPLGKKEAHAKNNHGVGYDLQTAAYALFVGDERLARNITAKYPQRRIDTQFAPDGTMPLEMKRKHSLYYHIFTMTMAANMAALGECVGIDLWHYQTEDGGGYRKVFEFLVPYLGNERAWQGSETEDEEKFEEYSLILAGLMERGAYAYPDSDFERVLLNHYRLYSDNVQRPFLVNFSD